jgi:hypothetical protein
MQIIQKIKYVFGLESEIERNHRIARELVRSYFPESEIVFCKESNGTVRFAVSKYWAEGFYRVRKSLDRGLGSNHEKSFDQIHCGKITIAVEKRPSGKILWNFSKGDIDA